MGRLRSHFNIYFAYLEKIDLDGKKILHIGSGWDKRAVIDKFKKAELFSIDNDLSGLKKNPNQLKFAGDIIKTPLKSGSFDYAICEDVLEHIRYPEKMLIEISIALKSGGEFIFITPNRWSYISIISKLTPLWFHRFYNRLRGVDSTDNYATYYKFNSARGIKKKLLNTGFYIHELMLITGNASYFSYSKLLTKFFNKIHFLIARFDFLNNMLGITIFSVLRK